MALVRGCSFPDHLFYDLAHHVWYAPAGDGLVRAGITPVGVALAREVLVFTPKRVGRSVEKGRAMATVESAKWVGSVRAGFDATIEAVNEALVARAGLANTDCYGAGWMLLLGPRFDGWRTGMVTGLAIAPAYEAWMEENGFAGCVAP